MWSYSIVGVCARARAYCTAPAHWWIFVSDFSPLFWLRLLIIGNKHNEQLFFMLPALTLVESGIHLAGCGKCDVIIYLNFNKSAVPPVHNGVGILLRHFSLLHSVTYFYCFKSHITSHLCHCCYAFSRRWPPGTL